MSFKHKPQDGPYKFKSESEEQDDEWKPIVIKQMIGCDCQKVVQICCGGFSDIFVVTLSSGQKFVVKSIEFDGESGMRRKDAVRESTRMFDHPHINQPLDAVEINFTFFDESCQFNYFFILLEYFKDKSLRYMVYKRHIVIQIFKQMVEALIYMNENKQFIHRDIKPDNIFVRSKSEDSIDCVLGDFGFLRSTHTILTNHVCGTRGFIAPEIVNMDDPSKFTIKSDIYALGKTILVLLTSKCETIEHLKELIVEKGHSLDDPLIQLALQMISADPCERPNYDDIKNVLNNLQ